VDKKSLTVLEYDKILKKLSEFASSEQTKKSILSMVPEDDIDKAKLKLDETDEAVSLLLKKGDTISLGEANILPALNRVNIGGILNLGELLSVVDVLKVARKLKDFVLSNDEADDKFPILAALADTLTPLPSLENDVGAAILSPEELSDTASPKLYDIRRKMQRLQDKIQQMLNDMIRSPRYQKYLQDPIITMRSGRYVLPVKSESRAEVAGVVHDNSSSGATLFVEPIGVVNANNDIRDLLAEESKEIERILAEFSARIGEHLVEITDDFHGISKADFMFARARLALVQNATKPALNTDGVVDLKNARHPLIDAKVVVANDIYLGKDFTTLVITGPNTGGKTVTLKTIGLLALMAASGMFVPARDNSILPIFDNVFADIGDEQSIEQSLSTFSSHMLNIVHILENITPSSLVLFDELGAGTDPTEGAALAVSILEYVRSMGSRCAATTHYSEIKMYALSTDGVQNASCEFDVKSLRPTYQLLIGIPGKSNAFAISQRLGLPSFIIDRAKSIISDENVKFEDVITDLEESKLLAEREKQNAEAMRRQTENYKEEIRKQNQSLRENRTKIMEKARAEANRIVENAREETNAIIKELQAMKTHINDENFNKKVEEARGKIKKQEEKVVEKTGLPARPPHKIPKNLIPGEQVEILSMNQVGSVLQKPDKNGDLQLQVGIMKLRANVKDLKRVKDDTIDKNVKKIASSRTEGSDFRPKTIKNEIDVRGMMVDEATYVIDKFLDDASFSGLNEVCIIHGKGTGALRTGVQNYLRKQRNVKTFRLGVYGEGESGVTIVELR